MSIWFCVQRRSPRSAFAKDCTAARVTKGPDCCAKAASKSISKRSFFAIASRKSCCGSEKWIRTLAVSGLVSTRSILSHAERRSATFAKNAASRRFSGTLIRNRRSVRWLMRAVGRLGMGRTGLAAVASAQPRYVVFGSRAGSGIRALLLGLVLGAGLGHKVARRLADFGRLLAPALIERDPGFEDASCRGADIP